jgi:hypothetical protein
MPEYRIVEASKHGIAGAGGAVGGMGDASGPGGARGTSGASGAGGPGGGGLWEVVARVANSGTARMPVEVAAASLRERFGDDARQVAGYRDVRATLVRLLCPFEPQRLVVDPDAKVLQLQRKAASVRL